MEPEPKKTVGEEVFEYTDQDIENLEQKLKEITLEKEEIQRELIQEKIISEKKEKESYDQGIKVYGDIIINLYKIIQYSLGEEVSETEENTAEKLCKKVTEIIEENKAIKGVAKKLIKEKNQLEKELRKITKEKADIQEEFDKLKRDISKTYRDLEEFTREDQERREEYKKLQEKIEEAKKKNKGG